MDGSGPIPQSGLRKALTYNPSAFLELAADESPPTRRQHSIFASEIASEYFRNQYSINEQTMDQSRDMQEAIEEESETTSQLSQSEAARRPQRNPPPKTKPIMPFRDRVLGMEEHANSLQKVREEQKRTENIEVARLEFPELGAEESLLKPPGLSEEEFKSLELGFPSLAVDRNESFQEFEKITNTALLPESIQNAYGIKLAARDSTRRKKKEKPSFNAQSSDVYLERTNAQGRKIRIRQIGVVNKSAALGDLSSYLTRDEMKIRAKSLAYAQYRKLRQEESKAKAHRKLMFLLVVVKCKAFATRMKRRILERRRLRELEAPPPAAENEHQRSSALISHDSSMRSFAGSFSMQPAKRSLKVSGSLQNKKFRNIRLMSEEESSEGAF